MDDHIIKEKLYTNITQLIMNTLTSPNVAKEEHADFIYRSVKRVYEAGISLGKKQSEQASDPSEGKEKPPSIH